MRHEAEMRAILKQVELWPAEERRWLAGRLAEAAMPGETVVAKEPSQLIIPPAPAGPVPLEHRGSILELVGIANPTGRHISDEEIEQMRYDAIMEKYGNGSR